MSRIFQSICLFIVCSLSSCTKEETSLSMDDTVIRLQLSSVSNMSLLDNSDAVNTNAAATNLVSRAGIQHLDLPMGDEHYLSVDIRPLSTDLSHNEMGSPKLLASRSEIHGEVRESLAYGTTYRVLIFDERKRFISSYDFVSGLPPEEIKSCNSVDTYNFIYYSLGSTEPMPALTLKQGDSWDKVELLLS